MNNYDYIVIGAGSAGCVVASRLSEEQGATVLLLEAGPKPRSPWIGIPAGVSQLIFPGKYNWGYETAPEPHLNNRRVYAPRGRTLGGSSAINGMAYVRGHRQDYDDWAQAGNRGWGWNDVLPFYKKFERFEEGETGDHGGAGELAVTSPRVRHPASEAFVAAGAQMGLTRRSDLNTAEQEGIGFLHFTIDRGRRASSATAFLEPAMSRSNLHVVTEAYVQKITISNSRASGVTYRVHGTTVSAAARAEVILCAGAFDSPRLLMLSGIGDPAELQAHGIAPVLELPGVGQNLQDHIYVHSTYRSTHDSSINAEFRGMRKYMHGAWYLLSRRGLLSLGASQAAAFVRALPGADRPDLQIMFRPVSWDFSAKGTLEIGKFPAIGLSSCQARPNSRGRVVLNSSDPAEPARIHANYLSDPLDRIAAVAGLRWIRRFASQEPLASRLVEEMAPHQALQTDDELLDYARGTMQSVHHWSGTCKMGSDTQAVVDETLKVRGIEGLRVADASIMPRITSGNTNAPTIMIGEKAASMILKARKETLAA